MPIQTKHPVHAFAYKAAAGVACVVIGFLITWGSLQSRYSGPGPSTAFAQIGTIHIDSQGYTFRAVLAVQTDSDNARWANKNQAQFKNLLSQALQEADPEVLRTPDGLRFMQDHLAILLNGTLDRPRVQQVLFTDFIIQTD